MNGKTKEERDLDVETAICWMNGDLGGLNEIWKSRKALYQRHVDAMIKEPGGLRLVQHVRGRLAAKESRDRDEDMRLEVLNAELEGRCGYCGVKDSMVDDDPRHGWPYCGCCGGV